MKNIKVNALASLLVNILNIIFTDNQSYLTQILSKSITVISIQPIPLGKFRYSASCLWNIQLRGFEYPVGQG